MAYATGGSSTGAAATSDGKDRDGTMGMTTSATQKPKTVEIVVSGRKEEVIMMQH